MARAFVFPGQGSQAVGMGKALADAFPQARAVFDEVDEALAQKLSGLMFEGPAETLTLTANAQPALMAVSLAAMRVLEAEAGLDLARDAAFVAGHSLGEYSALAAAGTFSIADAARLLRIRGDAMQKATPVGEGAMAALLGLDVEAAARGRRAMRRKARSARSRTTMAAAQVVVSGHKAAVERAVALRQDKGAKRAIMLTVSAPFHCALMAPAADAMREALAEVASAPGGAGRRQCRGAPLTDPARDPRRAGRAGDRRRCAGANASRRWPGRASTASTSRRRQGADRPGEADRAGGDRRRHRHAGGCGGVQGGARRTGPVLRPVSALKAARETIRRKFASKFRKMR